MSGELRAASGRLDEIKTAAAGDADVTRDDTLQIAEAGESWVVALLKHHGLEPEEAMDLAQELADGTVPNLAFMIGERRIDPRAGLVAAIGAGFFNGLGVGLETHIRMPGDVAIKLASMAVHVQEAAGSSGHPLDFEAAKGIARDPRVSDWLGTLDPALLPEKR